MDVSDRSPVSRRPDVPRASCRVCGRSGEPHCSLGLGLLHSNGFSLEGFIKRLALYNHNSLTGSSGCIKCEEGETWHHLGAEAPEALGEGGISSKRMY